MFTRKHPESDEKTSISLLGRRSVKIALLVLILGVAFLGIPAIVHAADPSGAGHWQRFALSRMQWYMVRPVEGSPASIQVE